MAKYIYARVASNDAVCVAINRITDISVDQDGKLNIDFSKNDNSNGTIVCSVNTSDAQEKSILLYVTRAIANNRQSVLTIGDGVTSEFIHENITAVDSITASS